MQALEGHLQTRGGSIILNTELQRVEKLPNGHFKLELATASGSTVLTVQNLFVAAGLGMADLRVVLPRAGSYQPPSIFFAKGHYFALQGPAPFQHLVYPVPVHGGLGIHLTLDLQGRARFGPDVHWVDKIDYGFNDPDRKLRDKFQDSIRRYWPGLPDGALDPGYTGIRPKVSGPGDAPLDFQIHGPKHHGIDRMVALYGVESPGLTASLAIAEYALALCDG
jgi:L-2-hydroxyglutarate oxidase LhgO